MKATNVTDVVKVEFGNDVDPEPYLLNIGDRVGKSGGGYRDRTDDPLTASQMLSQLS